MVTAFVGSGGKTTAIFTQAAQLRAEGKRVLVTTTTHLQTPAALAAEGRTLPLFEERYLSLTSDPAEIAARLESDGFCIAALPAEEPGKLAPLPPAVYQAVFPLADAVLVEADGSRGLPLKAPASHEPVIPANADEIVVLCGLSALGKPLSQGTHRLPQALALLPGADGNTVVDPSLILHLATAAYLEPLRRRFPGVPVRLLPGQADTLYRRCVAAMLSAELDPAPLRECWFAPAPHLVLLGGGHVSLALYRIARVLDWRVTVLDDRPEFADPARFPEAEVICADFNDLEKDLPTATYKVDRLSALAGHDVGFTLKALPYGKVHDIERFTQDVDVNILLAGCVEPNLKDERLQEKFGGATPADVVKKMLLAGEITDLSQAIEKLSGYRRMTITEVKNA